MKHLTLHSSIRRLTVAELAYHADDLAGRLWAAGVRPGARIAVYTNPGFIEVGCPHMLDREIDMIPVPALAGGMRLRGHQDGGQAACGDTTGRHPRAGDPLRDEEGMTVRESRRCETRPLWRER